MNIDHVEKIGFGIGHQITKIEKFIIEIIIRYFKLISRFLLNKFKAILFTLINHFKSSRNLSFYSKSLIVISILLFLIKLFLKYFNSNKGCLSINKNSNLFFKFNSNVISNTKFLFSKEKSVYVVNRNKTFDKLKKYIRDHKEKSKQENVEIKESPEDPYFKLMKFYLEYNNSHNHYKNYN